MIARFLHLVSQKLHTLVIIGTSCSATLESGWHSDEKVTETTQNPGHDAGAVPLRTGPFSKDQWFARLGVVGKLVLIVALIGFLNVVLAMVQGLVYEREGRQRDVEREVGQLWGLPQTLSGPVLAIPFGVPGERPGAEYAEQVGVVYSLPDTLDFAVSLEPEHRHRGIFETVVYTVTANISGRFSKADAVEIEAWLGTKHDAVVLLWDKAYVAQGVTDMRSVRKLATLRLGEHVLELHPGTRMQDLLPTGMSADLPDDEALFSDDGVSFSMTLELNGSEHIALLPLGRETTADVTSSWPAPHFGGAYLPMRHEISDSGFTAHWELSHFGRLYGQRFDSTALVHDLLAQINDSTFNAGLYQPVTPYRQVHRAVKYGLLFLVFTFGFYFIVEMVSKKRIHAVQYATVGAPLCLFYLLLIAFAEHIGFIAAYWLGAGAVVALVSLYSYNVLKSSRRAFYIATLLAALYGYLYSLLGQEEYSLLWGALGLFALVAVFMFVTRNVDWYGERNDAQPHSLPAV